MKAVVILLIDGEEHGRKVWPDYSTAELHVEQVINDMAPRGCRWHKMEQEASRWVETTQEKRAELIIGMSLF